MSTTPPVVAVAAGTFVSSESSMSVAFGTIPWLRFAFVRPSEHIALDIAFSPGAFSESLADIQRGRTIPLLRSHFLGDERGSSGEGDFVVTAGRYGLQLCLISARAVAAAKQIRNYYGKCQWSPGFRVLEDRRVVDGQLVILKARLNEISLTEDAAFNCDLFFA